MNDQAHESDSKVSARRRLIRGAFAAPAALTLYSGSVAARSIKNCVTNQVATQSLPDPVAALPTPTHIRVQLRKFQRNSSNNAAKWSLWVRGHDVSLLKAAGQQTFISGETTTNTSWYLFSKGTESKYASQSDGYTIAETPNENGTYTGTTESAGQWVALRVNASGDIVGVVGINNAAETSAVYQSCWTSFRVG